MAFISQRSGQSFFSQRSEYLFCAVSGIIKDYFDDETPSTKEYRQLRNFLRTRLPHIQESDKFLTKLPELFSDKEKHLEKYLLIHGAKIEYFTYTKNVSSTKFSELLSFISKNNID